MFSLADRHTNYPVLCSQSSPPPHHILCSTNRSLLFHTTLSAPPMGAPPPTEFLWSTYSSLVQYRQTPFSKEKPHQKSLLSEKVQKELESSRSKSFISPGILKMSGATDKFCLRWNDFETNISSAFKELREDKDFFDVTLACEDDQVQAHKVILSACSPFFKTVLRRNRHEHPLLYLKGVKYQEMLSVLNFMYHGEVNVAQDELNSFLSIAEELQVKGLTQNGPSKPQPLPTYERPPATSPMPPPKRPRPPAPPPPIEVEAPANVKCEPHGLQTTPEVQEVIPSHYMEEYSGYDEYEEEGGSYDDGGMVVQGAQGTDGNKGNIEENGHESGTVLIFLYLGF